ncbi:MAG TPA: DUF2892 domain-containing protein [Burkholderiales bacterium]|nr:DUF2892 domain-containing protein [Burkholderiales bacterium]
MKTNVGNVDRIVRIVAGLLILSLLFLLDGPARWWGLIGIVLLVTGFVRFCPAYSFLGMNTCDSQQKGS